MNSTDGKEQTESRHIEPTENPVALKMRQIYCCSGAQFAAPQLEAGWREIWRLEAELASLRSRLAEVEKERDAAMRALDSFTPSGSEFV